jgi:hypothetical protein
MDHRFVRFEGLRPSRFRGLSYRQFTLIRVVLAHRGGFDIAKLSILST